MGVADESEVPVTQHLHSSFVEGCYRCDIGRDELRYIVETEDGAVSVHVAETYRIADAARAYAAAYIANRDAGPSSEWESARARLDGALFDLLRVCGLLEETERSDS